MFQPESTEESTAVEKTVNAYFKSYLNAEAEDLARVFHPDSRLFTVEDGKLERTEFSDWLKNLHSRKAKGDIRKATVSVDGVDVSGNAAIAKATLQFAEFKFIDYLSLLKVQDHWTVINKIYTVDKLR